MSEIGFFAFSDELQKIAENRGKQKRIVVPGFGHGPKTRRNRNAIPLELKGGSNTPTPTVGGKHTFSAVEEATPATRAAPKSAPAAPKSAPAAPVPKNPLMKNRVGKGRRGAMLGGALLVPAALGGSAYAIKKYMESKAAQ